MVLAVPSSISLCKRLAVKINTALFRLSLNERRARMCFFSAADRLPASAGLVCLVFMASVGMRPYGAALRFPLLDPEKIVCEDGFGLFAELLAFPCAKLEQRTLQRGSVFHQVCADYIGVPPVIKAEGFIPALDG